MNQATNRNTIIILGDNNKKNNEDISRTYIANYYNGDTNNNISWNNTGNQTPSYYVAGVFEGTEANAATAEADHVGNIRVESGQIYIYV
jgi:hypothetical protein